LTTVRAVVVGAGVSGLTAARRLVAAGHEVVVFDKGRSPGGRLATRRIGDATLDHGAQFFTVRTDAFAAQLRAWERDGVARVWHRGLGGDADGFPRYVGTTGMNALAKDLATGLDVRCGHMVFAVRRDRAGWEVVIDDGQVHHADVVVMTCPTPQSFALLFEVGVEIPMDVVRSDYERTIALLAVLDRPGAVPAPGAVQQPDGDAAGGAGLFTFVGDNAAKGISAVPALTLHAAPGWSEARWDADQDETHALLLEAAGPWFGDAGIVASEVKRWRFATPRRTWPDPCWIAPEGTLVLAGDAFAGPRVEGAYTSGLAAADALAG
jgi:renalase